MIKRASLVLLVGFAIGTSTAAHAQMQQGYANDKPDVTVDRSVLQDLKGYQPPPMFGGDLMPPTTNRIGAAPPVAEVKKNVEVTPPSKPIPAAVVAPKTATMTAPNAEDLLSHPTQNFHVLTERNTSMTAPPEPLDNANGPLLPLPDEDIDPAREHAKALKAKAVKEAEKKEPKKADVKKDTKKKDADKKAVAEKAVAEKAKPAALTATIKKAEAVKVEPIKITPPNPNAYRPKSPQSMPAVPPIKVEKNILPPMANSPLPSLPPTTDTTELITKPSPGLRMMDAALERQMESDETKIKEQLAETNIKTVKPGTETEKIESKSTGGKALVFASNQISLSDKSKSQIKKQILPDLQKDTKSRIQIISFATADDKTENSARRISLSRALEVRDYLKSLKIDTERIDVKALPSTDNATPTNKVDIVLLK